MSMSEMAPVFSALDKQIESLDRVLANRMERDRQRYDEIISKYDPDGRQMNERERVKRCAHYAICENFKEDKEEIESYWKCLFYAKTDTIARLYQTIRQLESQVQNQRSWIEVVECAFAAKWTEVEEIEARKEYRVRWCTTCLEEVDISGGEMPTYRGVPLTAFKPDDLIRIAKQQMERAEAHVHDMAKRLL